MKMEAIQKRWQFKLGIDEGIEIPPHMLKVHPDLIEDKEL